MLFIGAGNGRNLLLDIQIRSFPAPELYPSLSSPGYVMNIIESTSPVCLPHAADKSNYHVTFFLFAFISFDTNITYQSLVGLLSSVLFFLLLSYYYNKLFLLISAILYFYSTVTTLYQTSNNSFVAKTFSKNSY